MLNTENRAHSEARDRAMREGRDIYLVLLSGRFLAVPKPPASAELLAGYHPSGLIIRETEDNQS